MALSITGSVQNYAWGKRGSSSEVALLAAAGNKDFVIREDVPYAELWMGTHPNGPSFVAADESVVGQATSLRSYITDHPQCLGDEVLRCFGGELPFLFKVLSVNEALSIQAHPDKRLAEELHRQHPDVYKDPNHKPEMAIALTAFQALCGFRPLVEISNFLRRVPELCLLIGDAATPFIESGYAGRISNDDLKRAFSSLMNSPADRVKQQLSSYLTRLETFDRDSSEYVDLLGDILVKLNSQFPGDVGCFCLYFLNYMALQPGDSMFLEANLPHAYLSGDCIECMACSDNVVRAGLTPKFKDVKTLCTMLKYEAKPAAEFLFQAVSHTIDRCTTVYNPPIADFAVHRTEVRHVGSHRLLAVNSASIVLVISGCAVSCDEKSQKLSRGTVLFLSAGHHLDVQVTSVEDAPLVIFRAMCGL